MKKLIPLAILLLSFTVVYSAIICQTCPEGWMPLSQEVGCQNGPGGEVIPCPTESEWLTEMKALYSEYIDSGIFFVVAIVVFFPIIIGGLSGLLIGKQGHVSRFVLELILGILTFLSFPVLVKYLIEMIA